MNLKIIKNNHFLITRIILSFYMLYNILRALFYAWSYEGDGLQWLIIGFLRLYGFFLVVPILGFVFIHKLRCNKVFKFLIFLYVGFMLLEIIQINTQILNSFLDYNIVDDIYIFLALSIIVLSFIITIYLLLSLTF